MGKIIENIFSLFSDFFHSFFGRYLKEFRVEQCPLFLQHKCTQHKPFTCFYWHFMNQRRRRPVRRRDGTFNYSPDVYCSKYDETTGVCPDGDEWVLALTALDNCYSARAAMFPSVGKKRFRAFPFCLHFVFYYFCVEFQF